MAKVWNVPDHEFKKLDEEWKSGKISDCDFTEALYELEQKHEKKQAEQGGVKNG